jgi:UDP-N-acetylglucosamine 4,6-dehydratase/5-epimerase
MTSVVVTGGTGTFGKAIVDRLLCNGHIEKVAVYSRDEQKQEAMAREISDPRLRFFLGDVRDEARLRMALRGATVVIHAAAMKIVPACEFDPIEAIKTNILGSVNVINAALDSRTIQKVIALSTDKAVSSTNLYGGTKFVAEKAFVAANNLASKGGAAFSVVRYGNVSGSRGSIIPKWRLLAALGRPLPITHLNMTRFWISIGDAVEFVLNGLETMQGGEVFIPKMPSFRIRDLGKAICGSGFTFNVIGIRPGEKLHEDIITVHEGRMTTENAYAYAICPPWLPPETPMEEGFSLSSERNDLWLSVDDLKTLMESMDA